MTPSIRPDGGGRFCILKNRSVVDLREAFQLGRAVGAADGLDGDLALAVGADLLMPAWGSSIFHNHSKPRAGTQEVSFGFTQT